jgi:hypothetical protein
VRAAVLVREALAKSLSTAAQSASYTATMAIVRVVGGNLYTAEVVDTATLTAAPGGNKAVLAPQDTPLVALSPVTGAATFRSHVRHRIASVALEEAWSGTSRFAPSGYGYVPISQTGGDQLFQMQGLDRPTDQLTLSALLVVYVWPLFTTSPGCARVVAMQTGQRPSTSAKEYRCRPRTPLRLHAARARLRHPSVAAPPRQSVAPRAPSAH